jgi:hypothetical protein
MQANTACRNPGSLPEGSQLMDELAHDRHVIERDEFFPDDLVRFTAFPGDEDHIVRFRGGKSEPDGPAAVGLSEVRMHRSERRPAISPMVARLVASRSPPQPKTVMIRAVAKPLIVVRTFSNESGEWA